MCVRRRIVKRTHSEGLWLPAVADVDGWFAEGTPAAAAAVAAAVKR